MARKVKRPRQPRSFADRVHVAMKESPLHTLMLNIEQMVGQLSTANIELKTSMDFVVRDATAAKESRAELHRTMNDVREGNAELTARVGNVEKEVSRIGQVVEKHEALYQQHLGKEELKKTVTERLSGAVTKGRAIWLALFGGGGLLATWHFWR